MVLTLRELLERIRPAGTPGAPTEGERQRRHHDRAAEVADLTPLLAVFEAEADGVISAAELDAERIRLEARQRAQQIAAMVPDRIATAGAVAADRDEELRNAEETAIRADAENEAAQLLETAGAAIPGLVDAALALIWNTVTAPEQCA